MSKQQLSEEVVAEMIRGKVCVHSDDIEEALAEFEARIRREVFVAFRTVVKHEVNNPLTAILGQAELMAMALENRTGKNLDRIAVIRDQAERIAAVVKRIGMMDGSEPLVPYLEGGRAMMYNIWADAEESAEASA